MGMTRPTWILQRRLVTVFWRQIASDGGVQETIKPQLSSQGERASPGRFAVEASRGDGPNLQGCPKECRSGGRGRPLLCCTEGEALRPCPHHAAPRLLMHRQAVQGMGQQQSQRMQDGSIAICMPMPQPSISSSKKAST